MSSQRLTPQVPPFFYSNPQLFEGVCEIQPCTFPAQLTLGLDHRQNVSARDREPREDHTLVGADSCVPHPNA